MNISLRSQKLGLISVFLAFTNFLGCNSATTPTAGKGNMSGKIYFDNPNGTVTGTDIAALDMSTGTITTIITGKDPFVTADHKIVFINVDIKECDLDGSNVQVIAPANATFGRYYERAEVSVDGSYIAYTNSDAVYVIKRYNANATYILTYGDGTAAG